MRTLITALTLIWAASSVQSDALAEQFLGCADQPDDVARLECYDSVRSALDSDPKTSDGECIIEAFQGSMRGKTPYITGAISCDSGKLNYRLFDDATGAFIESGFTYFEGYAFQFYTDTRKLPEKIDLRYTASPRR